jgi:2-hydroxychromene-2-carboxylate isomerase
VSKVKILFADGFGLWQSEDGAYGENVLGNIDFWYSIGSTYSYLTVMRLPKLAQEYGVNVRWRPFNVRDVMVEQNNVPFSNKPIKSAYMWRDIERRAASYGLCPQIPAPYPLGGLVLANQVAFLGVQEGWVEAYTQVTYRRWFEEGLPAGEEPNISESLNEIGQDVKRILGLAASKGIATGLSEVTTEAKKLGVFGSPSFVVNGEVFWGDDRLEDAIKWSSNGTLCSE